VDTTFTFSGSTMAAVADLKTKYGWKIKEDLVTGTTLPYVGTGGFHGEVDVTALGSSDSSVIWSGVGAVSGIVPTIGMTWKAQDTNGGMSGRTWTASGKIEEFQNNWSKDNVVEFKFKLILTNPPTVA
jgi:hypothetical protein